MADTWPDKKPAAKGWFEKAEDHLGGLWGAANPATLAGGGVTKGAETYAPIPPVRPSFADNVKRNATKAVVGNYPGGGVLWDYDLADGVKILPMGFAAIGGVLLAGYLLLGGGKRGRR